MNAIDFPTWLRDRMQEKGLSQAELSRLSGISEAHISRAISGRNVGEEFCRSIAHPLGLTVDAVFRAAGFLPQIPRRSERVERILSHLDGLPEDELERIDVMIMALAEQQKRNQKRPKTQPLNQRT